jgi:hypothetical protein
LVSQKGALYNDDYRNRGDEYFSDKSQGSKTTNASSVATAVSDSANGEGIELVAGRCRARTQARKYNDRWVICMGPHICKRTGHKGKREKGAVGKPGFYVAVYKKGGNQKVGVLEDTLMVENEARGRAGRLREANRALAAGVARTPPIGAKASVTLKGILHGSRKASPSARCDVKPYVKLPSKSVGETLAGVSRGRDGSATAGGLFVDLKLEGLDATQMDDLGGVTDEILAAQMEILAKNEVCESGEENVGDNSEDEESFSGRGTHNPAAAEFKSGARIVYLGQEGDEMILGYFVAVYGDVKGDPPFYTSYLLWLLKMISPPPCVRPSPIPLFFQGLASQKGQKGEEIVFQAYI